MKKIKQILSVACLLSIVSCAMPKNSAGPGWIYTEVKEGVSVNNNVPKNKLGQACSTNILGIIASGDSSINMAKMNGNIRDVATIDRDYFSVLGVFSKSCLLVRGN